LSGPKDENNPENKPDDHRENNLRDERRLDGTLGLVMPLPWVGRVSWPRYALTGEWRRRVSTPGRCMPGRRRGRSTLVSSRLLSSWFKPLEDVHPILLVSLSGRTGGFLLFSSLLFWTGPLFEREASRPPPREKRRPEPRLTLPRTPSMVYVMTRYTGAGSGGRGIPGRWEVYHGRRRCTSLHRCPYGTGRWRRA